MHSLLKNDHTFSKTLHSHETDEKRAKTLDRNTANAQNAYSTVLHRNTFKSPHDTRIRKKIQVAIPVLQTQTHNTMSSEKHRNMTHNNNREK